MECRAGKKRLVKWKTDQTRNGEEKKRIVFDGKRTGIGQDKKRRGTEGQEGVRERRAGGGEGKQGRTGQ